MGYAYTHERKMLTDETHTRVETCTRYVGRQLCYRLRKIRACVYADRRFHLKKSRPKPPQRPGGRGGAEICLSVRGRGCVCRGSRAAAAPAFAARYSLRIQTTSAPERRYHLNMAQNVRRFSVSKHFWRGMGRGIALHRFLRHLFPGEGM